MPVKAQPGPFGTQPIKGFLRDAGITHERAAAELGVSTSFLTYVVNGRSRPSLPNAARLARMVGRTVTECYTPTMLGLRKPRRGTL